MTEDYDAFKTKHFNNMLIFIVKKKRMLKSIYMIICLLNPFLVLMIDHIKSKLKLPKKN